jgi:hypothetical protein
VAALADLTAGIGTAETAPLSREERKLFGALVALIIIIAFPGKFLFYVSPGILILVSLLAGGFIRFWRLCAIVLAVLGLSLATIAFDAAAGFHPNWPGLVFGVLTYLPIFALWSLAKDFRVSEALCWRLANVGLVFILIEAALGAVQWVIAHEPDLVNGSFGFFDTVTSERTISQVNFCFAMFAMLVYCGVWLPRRRMVLACAVALAAVAVAETAHQSIFFVALMPLLALTDGRRIRRLVAASGVILALMVVVFIVDPLIVTHSEDWADKVLLKPNSPKRLAVEGSLAMMDGKNLVLGVGLGQFASRAAILSSGSGTSVALPAMLVSTSSWYDRYMKLPVFIFQRSGEQSAMAMPYFSALAVVTEFGLLFALLVLYKTVRAVAENIRLGATCREAWRLSCYCNFFIGFLFLCSFIQDYLELTQAIMIPILLYIVSKARLRTLGERAQVAAPPPPRLAAAAAFKA